MEEQMQLHKEFREKQEKYSYYIIALCITSIGFSVIRTSGQPLKFIQIPLAMAVLSWGLSVLCGFTFIEKITSSIYRNSMYLDIIQGRDPDVGTDQKRIEIATKVYREANPNFSKRASFYAKSQQRLFYLGIVLFIIWHILEMAYAVSR